ncbi:hypothetical protein Glove_60g166 [Diversispora epigaea]|uniref:Uncharacterized protein n=1 Tax=Diversispora epigaea TaxID=1348612 RepID=A0A397JBS0_9GLOM|nr:hypothetical protein Glove_60g166 [Diversispora epigaea]
MDLSDRLRLHFDQLENLRGKMKSFENDNQVRKDIKRLYGEMKIPVEKRIYFLNLEIERLREIMRAIIQKYNWLIFGINGLFLNMSVMNFSRAYKKLTDEIYE